jgi:hypothetical protein
MGSAVLGEAISAIRDWSGSRDKDMSAWNGKGSFGSLVFNDAEQQKRLPKNVYDALRRTVGKGEALDPSIADAVAGALRTGPSRAALPTIPIGSSRLLESLQRSTTRFWPRSSTAKRSMSSRAKSSSGASPTRRAFRPEACVPRSRPEATRRGIRPAHRGC